MTRGSNLVFSLYVQCCTVLRDRCVWWSITSKDSQSLSPRHTMIERSSSHVHLVLSILIRVWSSTSAILRTQDAKRLCVILTYFQNQKYGKRASAHLVFQLARLLLYLYMFGKHQVTSIELQMEIPLLVSTAVAFGYTGSIWKYGTWLAPMSELKNTALTRLLLLVRWLDPEALASSFPSYPVAQWLCQSRRLSW